MNQGSDGAEAEFRGWLARISEALGLSVSTFFGAGSDSTTARDVEDEAEAYLLRLVAAYLREAEPEARCRFAASVEALLQAESQ